MFILLDMDAKRTFQFACHRRDEHTHQMANVRDDQENARVLWWQYGELIPCGNSELWRSRIGILTGSLISNKAKGSLLVIAAALPAAFLALTAGVESSEPRCTSPSKKAYSESRKAPVTLVTNSGGTALCFKTLDDGFDEVRSTPPAILNAAVVSCRW